MSFAEELDRELVRRGVRTRIRRRIVLEYADHLACEPASERRLGDPAALARSFAAELAADDARRLTRNTFAALVLAAIALLAGQLAIAAAGGPPGYDHGSSTALALVSIMLVVLAPQVALIAGLLAALRAFRRRRARELPDAEVGLIRRRCAVGAAAGIATCAGLLLFTANFTQQLPAWWLALQAGLALLALVALAATASDARACSGTAPGVQGIAAGLTDDLPPLAPLVAHPWIAWALASGGSFMIGTMQATNTERSLAEGVIRGGFEGVAIAIGLGITIALSGRHRPSA